MRQWSPLHVAVLKGHKVAARALLSYKAICCLECSKCSPLIALGDRLPRNEISGGEKKPLDVVPSQDADEPIENESSEDKTSKRVKEWLKPEVGFCMKTKQMHSETRKKAFVK